MTNRPSISIITPAYNAAEYIATAIESVIDQTYSKWEMIIVDDHSDDDTFEIVNRWQREDDRIVAHQNQSNLGPGPTRNVALGLATGDYIAFLDSDDVWHRNKLELQLEYMERTGAVMTFTAYDTIDSNGTSTGRIVHAPERITYRQLLGNTIIGCLTVMVNRRGSPPLTMPTLASRQPLVVWLRVLRNCGAAHGLDIVLASYRLRPKSVSSNKLSAAINVWRVYREYEELPIHKASIYFACYASRGFWKNLGLRRRKTNSSAI